MERYESWIERAKSSMELAQAKIIRHIHYEDLFFQLQQAAETEWHKNLWKDKSIEEIHEMASKFEMKKYSKV